MSCALHPGYTGKKLGKRVKDCPECYALYLKNHPEVKTEAKKTEENSLKTEKVKLNSDAPVKESPSTSGWIVAIIPFGKNVILSNEQIDVLAKSAIRFGKMTGLGYTSFIKATDYLGLSKNNQVSIVEKLREMGAIKKTVDAQELADKTRREKVQ